MPLQLIALAKGAALVQTASTVLAQWNALAPEQKALIREPGLDVVKGLNALGANPQDLVSILQAMKSAGALRAELEII